MQSDDSTVKLSQLQKRILTGLFEGQSKQIEADRSKPSASARACRSRALRRLEQRGLVQRQSRGVFILTSAGQEIARHLMAWADWFERTKRGEQVPFPS